MASRAWVYDLFRAMLKCQANFLVYYIIRKGILDGFPGFAGSLMAAVSSSLKVAKAIELQERPVTDLS
jgi:hypothetical protein